VIPASPTRFHRSLLAAYFRRRLRSGFASVAARGLERLAPWSRGGSASEPLILLANHSSWWDAVLPIYLSLDHLDQDAYGIMEERQLARYRFFRRAGIFSIDRENPRSAMTSLRYAADLLGGHPRVLWFFPQGEIVPNDRRPIVCAPGAAHMIRMLGAFTIAPVAFRYELLGEERPLAWASIGETVRYDAAGELSNRALTDDITSRLTAEVDRLRDDFLDGSTAGFQDLLKGRLSIDRWWDGVRGKGT
jgi:chlorobactene lauroyltransferase